MINVRQISTIVLSGLALVTFGSIAVASPVLDGSIGGGEGWLLLTEAANAGPITGGQTGTSDFVGETASFNRWDGINNVNVTNTDNRGDVINIYCATDANFLYLAVAGPTVPFNAFGDTDSGDVGNLYLAVDASGGAASGQLRATDGHNTYGTMAVDYLGWAPTHVVGVQFVDNGGGGGGFADVQQTVAHTGVGEAQGQGNGGFDWNAGINSTTAFYDTVNGNAGEFEFAIPWSMLGLAGEPTSAFPLRLSAYTTYNEAQHDVYDSGPGIGNAFAHEEIGDCPGDPDDSGQLGACDPGSFAGSNPGSNFVADLNFDPGHLDGIDTVEEYLTHTIPEPASISLLLLGGTLLLRQRR